MKIRKGQKVRVTCTEARLKEVGVKQKHIKHILGKIGTVKEVRNIPDGNTGILCTFSVCES